MIRTNLHEVPFTCAGSYLKITPRTGTHSGRLMIATVRKRTRTDRQSPYWAHDFYEIALVKDGTETPYEAKATPWQLDLVCPSGSATFAFADPDTIVFEARGLAVRLLPCHPVAWHLEQRPGEHCLMDAIAWTYHLVRAQEGTLVAFVRAPALGDKEPSRHVATAVEFMGRESAAGALRIDRYGRLWKGPAPTVQSAAGRMQKTWTSWRRRMPVVGEGYRQTAEMAWLTLWSDIVNPEGEFHRPAMLMTKEWMNQVWSWDNCFNALAVAGADLALAFDQILLVLEKQDPTGRLPDSVNDLDCQHCYVKPPVYGWTVSRIMDRVGDKACRPFLKEAYPRMVKQLQWWYTYRDTDGDGMCQYMHGNDSGWDNATCFDQGYPTEGADLAAHLVLQAEGLARMARALGKPSEEKKWLRQARAQLRNLLEQGVRDNRFFAPLDGRRDAPPTQSLLNCIPLILGRRLPEAVRRALVADLSPAGPFLTEYGYATESPRSPKYESDGYWRGPIWAPPTLMIFDGLVDIGETALARTVAQRFCDMCVKEPGMWENFDALTGKGLRCPGYSWTAAVFLVLAEWLAKSESGKTGGRRRNTE